MHLCVDITMCHYHSCVGSEVSLCVIVTATRAATRAVKLNGGFCVSSFKQLALAA